jgi:CheY-like chemotaxis protein
VRVLIVDDNPDVADSTAELVAMWGHQTEVAYDGPAALRKAGIHQPDAGLLDIGMPGMDGYTLVAHLRQQQPTDWFTAFVAITAYSGTAVGQHCVEAGFDLHLVKPVQPALLERVLDRIGTTRELYQQVARDRQCNVELQHESRRLLAALREEMERFKSMYRKYSAR